MFAEGIFLIGNHDLQDWRISRISQPHPATRNPTLATRACFIHLLHYFRHRTSGVYKFGILGRGVQNSIVYELFFMAVVVNGWYCFVRINILLAGLIESTQDYDQEISTTDHIKS